jgi:hypothetical protein
MKRGIIVFLFIFVFSAYAREHDNMLLAVPNAASMAPKGFYYTFGYNSGRAVNNFDKDGGKIAGTGYRFQGWSVTNFFQWMTGVQFLGANYGMKLGFGYVDNLMQQSAVGNGIRLSGDGITDPSLAPYVLGWQLPQADITTELTIFFPVGYYSTRPNRMAIGQDHFTFAPKLGVTLYITEDKRWSAGLQFVYEYNLENQIKDIHQGEQFYINYSLTRQFPSNISVSAIGYYSGKVNGDTGNDANPVTKDYLDTVFALGPEIRILIPDMGGTLSLKFIKEFEARARSENDFFRISMTWKF